VATESHVARRIQRYVQDLAPLARTPYLYCPIGGDFNGPIAGLVELLDRYNRTRYESSGSGRSMPAWTTTLNWSPATIRASGADP